MNNDLDKVLLMFGLNSSLSRQLFEEKAEVKSIPKFTTIFEEGKRNNFEYLLLQGVLHRYNTSDKGDLVTTGFYTEQAVVTPHFARTKNQKNLFSLQTLTDTLIAAISVHDLDVLRHQNQEIRHFGQKTVEQELSKMFLSETINRSYSAKERLLILREEYPNLENLVPHHIIASYLGITNVSFSRLRSEISKR